VSDEEFLKRGESLANDRALFLIGSADDNRVTAELASSANVAADFPVRVSGAEVLVGDERIREPDLGTVSIRPNPRRPDRYVVVVAGTTPLGTWYSTYLPDLLPDYLVFGREVARSRGQILLGRGEVRAGGFFDGDWRLPAGSHKDPFAAEPGRVPKSEREATPYLP
jgi:hypothetical protein